MSQTIPDGIWTCNCPDDYGRVATMMQCERCGANNPNSTPYTDRDLIELACRAPACPEWFQPDMQGAQEPTPEQQRLAADRELGHFISKKEPGLELEYKESLRIVRQWQMEKSIRKIAQWPKAYARMVLESK